MKKTLCALLCALLCICVALCACGEGGAPAAPPSSAPATASNTAPPSPSPTAAPIARQRADAVLCAPVVADADGLKALLAAVTEKKEAAKAAIAKAAADADIAAAFKEEIEFEYGELKDAADAHDGGDYSSIASMLMAAWSELDDIEDRAAGYLGLCRAMCKGTDIFSFGKDASVQKDPASFPEGYFFDGYIPPFDQPCYFAYCDEYLAGYGMDEPRLALICKKGQTTEKAHQYAAVMRRSGLYTMLESDAEGGYMWSGCWVGDNGEKCYVTVIYNMDAMDSFIAELGVSPDFIVMSGNFDFMLCLKASFTYALNSAFK